MVEKIRKDEHSLAASDLVEDPFHGSVNYAKLDLLNRDRVIDVVKGNDVIVHFAASPLTQSWESHVENMRVNVEGTLNILDAARKHDVKKAIYSW